MKRRTANYRGFTLVELLVVIAIIVILIGILLPVLIRVKQQAQTTACAANLHQLGLAMTTYTQQFGYFPGATIVATPSGATPQAAYAWPVRLRKLLNGNQKVFYCPAQDTRCKWTQDMAGWVCYADDLTSRLGYELGERLLLRGNSLTLGGPPPNGTPLSYGYNGSGSIGGAGFPAERGMSNDVYDAVGIQSNSYHIRKVTSVKSAAEFIMIADTVADGWADGTITPESTSTYNTGTGVFSSAVGDIHRGGANVLFCDGHVQWYLQASLTTKWPPIAEDSAKQRLWNLDNLPARPW